jgi:alkyl hydroperoxide reductase subunit AhpC
VKDHEEWMKDILLLQGADVNFPFVADENGEICRLVRTLLPTIRPLI